MQDYFDGSHISTRLVFEGDVGGEGIGISVVQPDDGNCVQCRCGCGRRRVKIFIFLFYIICAKTRVPYVHAVRLFWQSDVFYLSLVRTPWHGKHGGNIWRRPVCVQPITGVAAIVDAAAADVMDRSDMGFIVN